MKILSVVPVLVCLLFGGYGCGGEDSPTDNPVWIELEEPIDLGAFAATLDRDGVTPHDFIVVSGSIQSGYTLSPDETMQEAVARFQALHQQSLDKALLSTETLLAAQGPDPWMYENLKSSLLGARADAESGAQKVHRTRMAPENLHYLAERGIGYRETQNADPGDNGEDQDSVLYSYYHESWAPYGGTSKVTQGISYQTFYFNNVSGYGLDATYEHETQVYDKNFANYGGYWSSNLPTAYYDTPFSDSIDIFTVGSAQASNLQTYTMYFTTMSLTAGSSPSATVRIKGQKGYRFPFSCYSTWCIFASATTGSMTTFTAPVQGISWQY